MEPNYLIEGVQYTARELAEYAESRLRRHSASIYERELFAFILEWVSGNGDIAVHTSGSTGSPKALSFTRLQMEASARRSLSFFGLEEGKTALLCLPVRYIAGRMMVVRAFTGGLNLVLRDPERIDLRSLRGEVEFAALVPLQLERLLAERQDIHRIRNIIIGGTSLSDRIMQALRLTYDGRAWETYGMTETLTHVAVRDVMHDETTLFSALPGIRLSLDDRDCLVIHDDLLGTGPIVTNDRVSLLPGGRFRLMGRVDNVINSGGLKIQPELIEQELASCVRGNFCISSVPDAVLGEAVVLVLEKECLTTGLADRIASLDRYERPKQILETEKIPLLHGAKPDRIQLRVMLLNQPDLFIIRDLPHSPK